MIKIPNRFKLFAAFFIFSFYCLYKPSEGEYMIKCANEGAYTREQKRALDGLFNR